MRMFKCIETLWYALCARVYWLLSVTNLFFLFFFLSSVILSPPAHSGHIFVKAVGKELALALTRIMCNRSQMKIRSVAAHFTHFNFKRNSDHNTQELSIFRKMYALYSVHLVRIFFFPFLLSEYFAFLSFAFGYLYVEIIFELDGICASKNQMLVVKWLNFAFPSTDMNNVFSIWKRERAREEREQSIILFSCNAVDEYKPNQHRHHSHSSNV